MSNASKRAKINSINSSKIKNLKDSSILEKSVISDIKNEEIENENNIRNKNNLSGMSNFINTMLPNDHKSNKKEADSIDDSIASKLSNLDDKKEKLKNDFYDSEKNYLKNLDSYTRENFNDDKIKMIQTFSKIFKLNIDKNQIQLQVNNEYLDSEKKIIQLTQKVEETEKSNKEFYNKCREKELEHLDKIAQLEKKLILFDKADVIMLQKQNEDYEIQISNLNKTVQNLAVKHSQDYENYNNVIEELSSLKESLVSEIDLTKKIKSKLKEIESKNKEENQLNTKVELVMEYNDIKRYRSEELNIDDERDTKQKKNNSYKIRASTRKKI